MADTLYANFCSFNILDWTNNFFTKEAKESYEIIISIQTPLDGSCYFHAIAFCYYRPYRNGLFSSFSGVSLKDERKLRIYSFRKKLASKLNKLDKINNNGKTYYENINEGALVEFKNTLEISLEEDLKDPNFPLEELQDRKKFISSFSLEEVQERLANSTEFIDFTFHGFISNWTDKDIYILEEDRQDVYVFDNADYFYRGRNSIIINYSQSRAHYETVGLLDLRSGEITTYFSPDHELIVALKKRVYEKIQQNKDSRSGAAAAR